MPDGMSHCPIDGCAVKFTINNVTYLGQVYDAYGGTDSLFFCNNCGKFLSDHEVSIA